MQQISYSPQIADAIIDGNVDLVKKLFEMHPEQMDVYTPFGGGTWLNFAAGEKSIEIVKFLVNLGVNINRGDRHYGRIPLSTATSAGKVEIVKYLIEQGSKLDTSASVRNPLFAVSSGASLTLQKEKRENPSAEINWDDPRFLSITTLLLNAGIDASVRYNTDTMKNMDAVAFATMWGQKEIARLIAAHLAEGDETKLKAILDEADKIADLNTEPVDD